MTLLGTLIAACSNKLFLSTRKPRINGLKIFHVPRDNGDHISDIARAELETGELSLVAVRKGDQELENSPQVAGGTKATQDQTIAEDGTRGDQQHPDPDQDALTRTIGV